MHDKHITLTHFLIFIFKQYEYEDVVKVKQIGNEITYKFNEQ